MTEQELLQRLNAGEQKLTLWGSIHASEGFGHWVALLGRLKTDQFEKDTFCKLFNVDPANLPSMMATADQLLLLGDQVAADAPADTQLIDKFKGHEFMVKLAATLLG